MLKYRFECSNKFKNEFNKLVKKCPSLKDDFDLLKEAMAVDLNYNKQKFPQSKYEQIAGLGKNVTLPAFIVKKFRCKAIKKGNRSGFRFTFVFHREELLIYFVEAYFKSKKEMEDKNRIIELFK
ncbi:hypothetical protein [Methanobrevibacter curvatus]|uniref:Toxin HigB-2 n=1 Tax=Methanobrevibacter curvatus TaxID=49547 RepID=A0A162FL16_9EURY|nr:hypothetical protein [Methanobrevibacter curvatus]KZX11600.1 hypothetical protein MBCUR_13540 [Methanobrevibacter curvatus]